jgi:hypothetical protein
MTPERWTEVKELLRSQYTIDYEATEPLENSPGTMEVFEFDGGPAGYLRVEFVQKPRQLGRKVLAAARAGSESREEMVFSDTETVSFIRVFRLDDATDEWEELEKELFT